MPSRKTESSDTRTASRRSSLHRLSSIASFQTLFGRRRSNNNTDPNTNSSSSNLSLSSSTIANAPEPVIEFPVPSYNSLQDEDTLTELPSPPLQSQGQSRRSGYICLPDDPIGGMPRSRTFSNLPLPTRAKKTAPLVSSKSHSRLPPAFLPSSRFPSPQMSTRQHSHTRLTSAETNIPVIWNRMKRSGTEPLLGVNGQPSSNVRRSTAFKENISLSPIKALPAMDMFDYSDYGSALSPTSYASRPAWQDSNEATEPLLWDSFTSSSYLSSFAQHPAVRIAREYRSSPAYRSAKDRPSTPGGSKVNHHTSQQREIQQTRLMSARQAPTPPLAKTPSASQQRNHGKPMSKSKSGHIRQSSEESPTRTRSSPKDKAPSPKESVLDVYQREPPSYWLGRLSALADRYRNEELAAMLQLSPSKSTKTTPKSQTDKMHTPEATTARLRRAFEELHERCRTQEAKDSLVVFQLQYATAMKNPDLSRPIVLNGPSRIMLEGSAEEDGDAAVDVSMSEGRKASLMDRLLGRQKRQSVVLT